MQRGAGASLIVRTSEICAGRGKTFMHTVLKLMRERDEIGVVSDQAGTPANALNLAVVLCCLCRTKASGVYHFSGEGARAGTILRTQLKRKRCQLKQPCKITPIFQAEYPTLAKRSKFRVLDKPQARAAIGTSGQHLREALRDILQKVSSNA